MDANIARLKNVIGGAERIVLFTGAGFSVPSGIPDFRSAGGIYEGKFAGYSAEYMLSHECLVLHPELFFEFYKSKMLYPDAQPNAAHRYFAKLERQGKLLSAKDRASSFPSSRRTSTGCIRRQAPSVCGNCTAA